MRILVVSPEVPFPPIGGGALRTYHLVRVLAREHAMTLVGLDQDWATGVIAREAPFAVRIIAVSRHDLPTAGLADPYPMQCEYERGAALSAEPWLAYSMTSRGMQAHIEKLSREAELILIEHSGMAAYLPSMPRAVGKILDLHNVHSRMAARSVNSSPADERPARVTEFARVLRFERNAVRHCDMSLAVSDLEAAAATRYIGAAPAVIPNGVDLQAFQPSPPATKPDVLFCGLMGYRPNADAVRFFIREVWPAVRAEVPAAAFHVVGAEGPERGTDRTLGITFHGSVPSTGPHIRDAGVVVVPILEGGGTRIKILEAAACGKAIVSTTIGAEGLPLIDGQDLVIADRPADFADAVISLLRSADKRAELGHSARAAVQGSGWDGIGERLLALIASRWQT